MIYLLARLGKSHAQHLKLYLTLEIWFLLWGAFYSLSLVGMFLTSFFSDLHMPILFTNWVMHTHSPIFFLPVYIHIFVDINLWDLTKELTSLCTWCAGGPLCFLRVLFFTLQGFLCQTIAPAPSATSVHPAQVLLPRLLWMQTCPPN